MREGTKQNGSRIRLAFNTNLPVHHLEYVFDVIVEAVLVVLLWHELSVDLHSHPS